MKTRAPRRGNYTECRTRLAFPYRVWGALACAALLALTGCGISLPAVRTPTRPDNAGTQTAVLTTDILGEARACVRLGAPRTVEHTQMLNLLNDYRERNGLNRLRYSRTLEQAADQYALRMFREDFFDHVAPDGSEPADRALAAGFCDRFVGENIAWGLNTIQTAEEALEGFINSPGHNENMLRPRWDYVGLGVLRVSGFEGVECWWVQLFGTEQEK
jgi:uncharacterized protein YkwD